VNCLRLGGERLCEYRLPEVRLDTEIVFDSTTCRAALSLLQIVEVDPQRSGKVTIDARNCIFDIDPARGALLELSAADHTSPLESRIDWTGEGSLVPDGLATAARIRYAEDAAAPAVVEVPFEGLIASTYQFAGGLSHEPADAEVADCDAPRRSPLPPGIRPGDLPGGVGGAVAQ
jgi:hypothetical protein